MEVSGLLYDPDKTYDDNFKNGPFLSQPVKTYVNTGQPEYSFLGKKLYSPFGIPAGPLLNSNHVKATFELGFDVVCYKTQRSEPFGCNQFPNVLFLDIDGDLTLEKASKPLVGYPTINKDPKDISITNSFGNPSSGPEYWVDDLKQAISYQKDGQLLIMSVVGTIKPGFGQAEYYKDFAATAEIAAKAGAQAIEVNLSCPNVANEAVICYSKDADVSICGQVKERIGNVPLIAKLGYFSADQQALLEDIVQSLAPYVSAFSVINTISGPVVDENGDQALPGPNRLYSGICGKSIKWAGLDMVGRLDAIRQNNGLDFEIIGVGGVMQPADFEEYLASGADVVQSATAAMWNPNLAAEIKSI